jgi:hypothetical protein
MNKFLHPDQATDATAGNEIPKPPDASSVSDSNQMEALQPDQLMENSETEQISQPETIHVPEIILSTNNSIDKAVEATNDSIVVSPSETVLAGQALENQLSVSAEEADDVSTDEHDDLHPQIAFHELSRAELLKELKDVIDAENPDLVKHKFIAIREAYFRVKEEETASKRSKFIENGGEPDDFEIQRDDTDQHFEVGIKAFLEKKAEYRKQKEKELQDNLKKKKEILAELKQLMSATDNVQASFDRLHELQAQWRSVGLVPVSYIDELWKNYHHHVNNFYEVIKINKELRELDQKRNLELKTSLCIRAEELFLEPSVRKSLDEYKDLQDQWKQIGQASREQNEVVWERFRAAGDKLFDRRREFILEQEKEFNENLQAKSKVAEQTEALLSGLPFASHQAWQEASEKMAALLEEWKKTGFAGKKDNEQAWKRFRQLRDRFYQAKEEFYKNLRESQAHHYKLKVDLCMEAEALKESTDWKKAGDRMRELQDQWKKTGPVSKKHAEKLWQRFRAACDAFYDHRKEFFSGMNQSQDENLRLKRELVDRIQLFEQGADGHANFEALKAFQAEWVEIGHVPVKEKDKLQKDYRSAIDRQFAKLKAENADARKQLFRSQIQNLKQQPGGKDRVYHQRQGLQEKIRKVQAEIQTWENNIGFLGRSKAADDLKLEISKKIEKARHEINSLQDQLKILKEE